MFWSLVILCVLLLFVAVGYHLRRKRLAQKAKEKEAATEPIGPVKEEPPTGEEDRSADDKLASLLMPNDGEERNMKSPLSPIHEGDDPDAVLPMTPRADGGTVELQLSERTQDTEEENEEKRHSSGLENAREPSSDIITVMLPPPRVHFLPPLPPSIRKRMANSPRNTNLARSPSDELLTPIVPGAASTSPLQRPPPLLDTLDEETGHALSPDADPRFNWKKVSFETLPLPRSARPSTPTASSTLKPKADGDTLWIAGRQNKRHKSPGRSLPPIIPANIVRSPSSD